MNNSALPYGLDRRSRCGATGKGGRKIFRTKTPHNPLKSLDSDERIQGNPRKSKAQKRGLQTETPKRQENPNLSRLTDLSARRQDGSQPTLPKCKAR
jgi:hypothetical protein